MRNISKNAHAPINFFDNMIVFAWTMELDRKLCREGSDNRENRRPNEWVGLWAGSNWWSHSSRE
jgi:hypothetical protein